MYDNVKPNCFKNNKILIMRIVLNDYWAFIMQI